MNNNLMTLCNRIVALAVVSFSLLSCSESVTTEQSSKKYNYVVIFADDMGYGDLGVYGHPTIKTPYLDQMAAEGQKWTNFYVGASVCTPSRAALLTGRLPIRSGMAGEHNRVLFPDSEHGLPESELTIAEQLKEGGYATACIGKWHLGHKEQYLPTNNGFDYYFGIPYSNDMDNVILQNANSYQSYFDFWKGPERQNTASFNVPLMRNTEIIERPADQNTITKRYTQEAIQYIKRNKEKPFFLYLAHNLPHVPLFASDDFRGKSLRGIYGDVVEEIDFSVGQVLNTLKDEGLAENTIVVFTSDNGPWLIMNSEGGSAGLLKDGKGSTWEGGMREPCIFWSPGNIKPGVIADLGTTMDLFATFSSLSGLEIPNDREMDSVDLSSVLFENKASDRNDMFYYRNRELYAVRLGEYKAHFITQGAYGQPAKEYHETPLLYNLNVDPSEKYDISTEHPEVLAEIEKLVEKHNSKMIKGEDQLESRTPN
ncbi:sulfatase family protein [Jiulongibacter sediminis]|nr:sulfatase [Jiulongibacter sediminis]